jgi:putative ATP-dependent endonuclease of the OLD family
VKIKRLKLQNFKRFKSFTIDFEDDINILIGDNECGKSSILSAINLVLSGSKGKVDAIGLESLFNADVIHTFLTSAKEYSKLPTLFIEVYLDEQTNPDLNGKNNSENRLCDGLRLECVPNDELSKEITEVLSQADVVFPFEYYSIRFNTFQGEGYTGYRRFVKHLLLDNSLISSDYAIREYVNDMYNANASIIEKNKHQNEYRKSKELFTKNILQDLNLRLNEYTFAIKHNSKANMETDLTLNDNDVHIENKGKGKQCFVKTEFALSRSPKNLNVVLIEEPENHLSHINMKKLISRIDESKDKQLFISTHSNMISARLDLRKCILINSNSTVPVKLSNLPEATARFFIKAPDNNILDFILSKKVILVEGDAEYMLMESFFERTSGNKLANSDVHILAVDGTSFKRYLDIAKLLNIKTSVIRDNDGDYNSNCVQNYSDYPEPHLKLFADTNNANSTFEICIYNANSTLCEKTFSAGRRTLTVQEYMLKNKAEAAFNLLEKAGDILVIPDYIVDAITWIRG